MLDQFLPSSDYDLAIIPALIGAIGAIGGAALGAGGSKVGEWIGGKFGEKGKYKSQKFNGFGSDVDS